ncbi:hypothetical protein BDM02DRAFT_3270404 [Thelephora ganbajun]|uniref:Uncharacterized protein n=1 Tax=Thelephora ganbajun TaxID=370292 RepID=A0ACB6ZBV2_THEGA|nr:hypothetical protein BDM02DRAFT_3270404 [Thelephora ganbajun]
MRNTELAVRRLRQELYISPHTEQIDTVAAEFPDFTNYLYTAYNGAEHDVEFQDPRCNGPRIQDCGLRTVMVKCNPETVSTGYGGPGRLYFGDISLETILDIYDTERSRGVMLSMAGQTSNNIALPLHRQMVHVYGTSPEMVDTTKN